MTSAISSPPRSHCENSSIQLSYHGQDLTVEEYKKLVTRLTENLRAVTVMNDKWQKYNEDREKYVKRLRDDLENYTKKLLPEKEKELSETRARERQFEKTVKDQQTTISNFSKLMDELDQKDDRERALMMRVRELEAEVDSLKKMRDRPGESRENVKLLQQQLEVCIDDFKSEKKEKERYRDEARTLRKKSEEVETLLQEYQEKLYQRPPKPSSWSYPSEFPSFSNSIVADGTSKKGSQSDTAVDQAGASGGVPSKPLVDLFPNLKRSTEKTESGFGSDSVFPETNDEVELIRH
ncbi:hypothetical protein HOLleu_33303 [Holothuria leucospilota]|uniref:Uncharacterized protein n=1 Tax=Holothuria leucospilota TaxID=206669 RepID=A0A9Q0YTH8_HOLLE|nr:hypothetical protein HOLleu_33303 [Holothuria leucospilota]